MEDEIKDVNDVEEESSAFEEDSSNSSESEESDKEKNLRKLRERNKQLEEENERLKKGEQDKRNLGESDNKSSDIVKVLFDRDMKSTVKKWNKDNPVSASEWEKIKGKVSFKGDEDADDIYQKITEAYESLPEVKAKKEKAIADKAKAEALGEFTGEEMDLGTGGGEPSGTESAPKFNQKTKKMLDAFGVPEKVRKTIKP